MTTTHLSWFLLGDLRLLVEDLCQTLLSLGVFGLYYWQSLRWLRLDPPVAELFGFQVICFWLTFAVVVELV